MRSLIALIAVPLTLLGGCTTLTLTKPDELYLTTDYAPRPLTTAGVAFSGAPAAGCETGLGVQPMHGEYPRSNVEFRVLPGMTLAVEQATGRLSGASEVPTISRWTWRIPNTADWACGRKSQWSQGDAVIVRAILQGAQASVGAGPPAGDVGTATAWGISVRCVMATEPDAACGAMPQASGDRIVTGLYQPFARGLGFRIRPERGPLSGTGLARQVSGLAERGAGDTPANDTEWTKAIACEDPSQWSASPDPWSNCRPPLRSLVFSRPLAEATGGVGEQPIVLAPILRRSLTLLEATDPLMLSAPRPLKAMANPSFDLSSGAPGTGGGTGAPATGPEAQRPLAGEAYQGFTSIELMIPIQIRGERETMLVPVTTTAASLGRLLNRPLRAVGRLGQWLPETISVVKDSTCKFKRSPGGGTARPSIRNCALIPAKPERTYLRIDKKKGTGRFLVHPEDLLLAPGDLVVLG